MFEKSVVDRMDSFNTDQVNDRSLPEAAGPFSAARR
jgi:hypothetical protein